MTTDRTDLHEATSTMAPRAASTSQTRRKRHGGKQWAVELPEVEVRKRIEHALASLGPRDAVIGGSASLRGFVIKFRSRRHVRAAEVELAGWEGGTQVHVALPAEYKSKELAALINWLRPVLGICGAAEQ